MNAVITELLQGRGNRSVLEERLEELRKDGRIRNTIPRELIPVDVDLASNDYLGLSDNPAVTEAAIDALRRYGLGAASSRVVTGTTVEHEYLERELATLLGADEALVFGAGYLANVGLIGTIAEKEDLVLADRMIHASLIDGILLTRARFERFRHNDAEDLERRLIAARNRGHGGRILIVTESVFSMDGDLSPLDVLLGLAVRYGATLIVDEAHAFGVFGPKGAGRVRELLGATPLGAPGAPILVTGTLSKALGSYGGFVAGPRPLRTVLVSSCRSFVYNTALPPVMAAGARAGLKLLVAADEERLRLRELSSICTTGLQEQGVRVGSTGSQIIPILLGDGLKVLSAAERMLTRGIRVAAIRRPTVPPGGERLRLSLHSKLTPRDMSAVVRHLVEELEQMQPKRARCG